MLIIFHLYNDRKQKIVATGMLIYGGLNYLVRLDSRTEAHVPKCNVIKIIGV